MRGLSRFRLAIWADPQTLNLYGYVRNNPLSKFDPDGHHWWNKLGNLFTDAQCWCEGEVAQKAAAKNRVTTDEYNRQWPQAMQDPRYQVTATMMMMAMLSPAIGEEAAEGVAIEGVAIEGAAAEGVGIVEPPVPAGSAPQVTTPGVPQPAANGQTMVGPSGTAIKIKAGQIAEPAANGNGIVFRTPGTTGNAGTTRIMGPDNYTHSTVRRNPMNASILVKREMIQLSVGAYQLIFNFEGEVTLSVESGVQYWLDGKEGEWQIGIPSSVAVLVELVGGSIHSAEIGTDNDLSLAFDAGQRVVISGSSANGEAYQLTSPAGVSVV